VIHKQTNHSEFLPRVWWWGGIVLTTVSQSLIVRGETRSHNRQGHRFRYWLAIHSHLHRNTVEMQIH